MKLTILPCSYWGLGMELVHDEPALNQRRESKKLLSQNIPSNQVLVSSFCSVGLNKQLNQVQTTSQWFTPLWQQSGKNTIQIIDIDMGALVPQKSCGLKPDRSQL